MEWRMYFERERARELTRNGLWRDGLVVLGSE